MINEEDMVKGHTIWVQCGAGDWTMRCWMTVVNIIDHPDRREVYLETKNGRTSMRVTVFKAV